MADLPRWAKPQKWMKNPVATNTGWVNSVTGEKLSGHRGLKDKIDALTPAPVAKKETPKKKTAKTKSED
jgi:hypothetical protein